MSKEKMYIMLDEATLECLKEVTDYYAKSYDKIFDGKMNINTAVRLLAMEKLIEIKMEKAKSDEPKVTKRAKRAYDEPMENLARKH